jgi:hypothetical protein
MFFFVTSIKFKTDIMKAKILMVIMMTFSLSACVKNYKCQCGDPALNTTIRGTQENAGKKCQEIADKNNTQCAVPI